MFSSYEKNQDPQRAITFGDGNQGLVKGLGKIAISPDHTISNVFLVNSLDYNLLSVSQLCQMGKLWYTGTATNKNGVGVLIDKSLKDGVVDVKRVGDRIILVKLVIGDLVLNVISAYAPQVGLNENSKM